MIRVGIAGIPYHVKGGGTQAGIRYLAAAGLDAMEVAFVRNVYMTPASAAECGAVARECDVALSIHAPYYINLTSKSEATREKSKDWILKSLRIAAPLGARIVVFHPARDRNPGLLRQHLEEIADARKKEGLLALIGLEVTGDAPEPGGVEDYVDLLRDVPGTDIVVDWAHVHARTGGRLHAEDDYGEVFDLLRPVKQNDFHMHFSNVEHKDGREVRHLPLGGEPPFAPLARVLAERKISGTIICETPLLEDDALRMRSLLMEAD